MLKVYFQETSEQISDASARFFVEKLSFTDLSSLLTSAGIVFLFSFWIIWLNSAVNVCLLCAGWKEEAGEGDGKPRSGHDRQGRGEFFFYITINRILWLYNIYILITGILSCFIVLCQKYYTVQVFRKFQMKTKYNILFLFHPAAGQNVKMLNFK